MLFSSRKMHQISKLEQFWTLFKDEAALRQALIALLEHLLGTSNIRHTHGPNERGKDIIFDSPGPFGQTYLVACVVKNDKITGSADTNSGARNVYNQAEQALGLSITDTQGLEQRVSQVFVISPAECSSVAIDSIKDKLQSNGRRVTFICGPELLNLFEKHYPDFLLFQSGLFGSYVAGLEKEFDNDEPISNVLLRSGFSSGGRTLSSVYVRPSFFKIFNTFNLLLELPDVARLEGPVQEYVVEEFQAKLRRIAQFLVILLSSEPEARQLEADLIRFGEELSSNWRRAFANHTTRRDLPPDEQTVPRKKLSFEIADSVLLIHGANLIERCRDLLESVEHRVKVARHYALVDFESSIEALLSEPAKDVSALDDLSQLAPTFLVPVGDGRRIEIGSNLLDLVDRDLLIVGPAGFGKSSFCRSQALHDFGVLRSGAGGIWPAYVALHRLAEGPLRTFEESILRNHDLIELWKEARLAGAASKRFRIYLDGLDEIPSVTRQREVLSLALAAKQTFPKIQLVVTSRDHVAGTHLQDLVRIRIREFDDSQIKEFSHKWFGEDQAGLFEFENQLSKLPSLYQVMRVPLLATLVLGVYRNTKALPESRVSLYEMFIRLLAGGWDLAKRVSRDTEFGPTPKLTVLIKLASLLHIGRRRDATESHFRSATKATLPGLLDRCDRLLEEVVQDGFLVPAGPNYMFAHLSFQEFLAAKDLFEPQEKRSAHAIEQYLIGDQWWREVVLFYLALSGKPKQLEHFVRGLSKRLVVRTGDTSIYNRAHLIFEEMTAIFPGCNPNFHF